jgi:hypothetical protein
MKILSAALVVCMLNSAFSQTADEPAKKRLSVNVEKVGISVAVKDDNRTLVAQDKQGKVLWEVDVIKTVGQPVIRHMTLKDGKVTVVYGKHSFADFDLKSGKLLASGSD